MNYLIDGCYGDGNVGDECLLEATCGLIRQHDPRATFTVFTSDVEDTRTRHGLDAILQANPFGCNIYGAVVKGLLPQALRAIRRCDVFVLGGGELFRDSVGSIAMLGMFYRLHLARRMGKRTVALGVGAQPPTTRLGRLILRTALHDLDAALFRDPESLAVARQIAPHLAAAKWAPDMVFSLDWRANVNAPRSLASGEPWRVGVALKHLPAKHCCHRDLATRVIPAMVEAFCQASMPRLEITLLTFADDDRPLANQAVEAFRAAGLQAQATLETGRRQLQNAIRRQDCLLAMPFHASVFAAALGVPAIGLAYDAKVTRLYREFDCEEICFPVSELHSESLASALKHLRAGGPVLGRHLSHTAQQMKNRVGYAVRDVLAGLAWQPTVEQGRLELTGRTKPCPVV